MPHEIINCPNCQHKLAIAEGLGGKRVKCPGCMTVLTVPMATPPPGDDSRASVTAPVFCCPYCQRNLRIPESLLGKQVKCPTCAGTFQAGQGSSPSAVQADGPASAPNLADTLPPPPPPNSSPAPDPSGISNPESPRALGKYEIVRQVGRGGMGIVYQARDTQLERLVAVKVLPGALFTGPEAVQRLLREARVGASLDHPNICRVLDAGQEGSEFYFVMEYLEGETLRSRVSKTGPLPVTEACKYGAQLVQALRYLAHRNIVHRDIKPSNLMICENDQLKLMDLGLAKDFNRQDTFDTATGHIVGTPSYMSPEQARGDSTITPQTDLYAAGATLYELVVGDAPFAGPNAMTILVSVMMDVPPDPRNRRPDLPESLASLILRLLDKKPENRPTHEEVLHVLQFAAGFSPGASPPVAPKPPAKAEVDVSAPTQSVRRSEVLARIEQAVEQLRDPDQGDLLDWLPKEKGKIRLGSYYLGERAGPKAVITTYQAQQYLTGIPHIVRLFPPAFSQMAPERLEVLLRQRGRLMQISMQCPHLARLVDIGKTELQAGNFKNLYYTVEDFLPGTTFEQRIEAQEQLEYPLAAQCLLQTATGLLALHREELIHGNLHPGKLFFDTDASQLRLSDLSLARSAVADEVKPELERSTVGLVRDTDWLEGHSSRRRQYLAPEIISDGVKPNVLTEQYALGVIFIEALTGQFLQTHENDVKLITLVRGALEKRLRTIARESRRGSKVLNRMVATDPQERFSSLRDVQKAIAWSLKEAQPIKTRPQPSSKPVKPAPERKPPAPSLQEAFDVFLSYRRNTGAETARLILERLERERIHGFLDVDSLASGEFDEKLLTTIEETPHFVVILTQGSLDRCRDPEDWLRREISHALQTQRNIIPVFMPGFQMPERKSLPGDLRPLAKKNGIEYNHRLFEGFIGELIKFIRKA